MKHTHPFRRHLVCVTTLLALTLCFNARSQILEYLTRPNMTELSARLLPLFEKTRTVCFGHFVMEVPDTAEVVFGPTNVDWPIFYLPGEADKIAQHVTEQLIKIEEHRDYLRKGSEFLDSTSMFGKVIDGAIPGQKLIFGSVDHVFYSIYSYIPVGADLFIQLADSVLSKDEEIQVLNTVARHLRLRADTEVPTEPGTCIDGGFVNWQPEFQRTSLGVRLKEFPDVHFSIVAAKKFALVNSDSLETRLKRAEQDAQRDGMGELYARIKVFRRGPRQLNGWTGFEALARKPAFGDNTEAHEFLFFSQGVPKDPLHPELDVQLNTGVKDDLNANTPPSLTDEEAVALWDKLTNSIRLRSTNPAKPAGKSERPKTPLGKTQHSGNVCPQSGWWECYETYDIAGGKRQHFKEGVILPQAATLGPRSLWQVIKGERPSFKADTVWRLMQIDAEPGMLN